MQDRPLNVRLTRPARHGCRPKQMRTAAPSVSQKCSETHSLPANDEAKMLQWLEAQLRQGGGRASIQGRLQPPKPQQAVLLRVACHIATGAIFKPRVLYFHHVYRIFTQLPTFYLQQVPFFYPPVHSRMWMSARRTLVLERPGVGLSQPYNSEFHMATGQQPVDGSSGDGISATPDCRDGSTQLTAKSGATRRGVAAAPINVASFARV